MFTELFELRAAIDLTVVHFKGGNQQVIDLLGGHSHGILLSLSAVRPHILSGKLNGLAATSLQRHEFVLRAGIRRCAVGVQCRSALHVAAGEMQFDSRAESRRIHRFTFRVDADLHALRKRMTSRVANRRRAESRGSAASPARATAA